MDFETKEEFAKVHAKLERFDENFARIDEKFGRIDEKFGRIDEKFDRIDEKFDRIDEKFDRIDGEFRTVHASFNQVSRVMHEMRLMMEDQAHKLNQFYDSTIGKSAAAERVEALDVKVAQHEVRIEALEIIHSNPEK